MKRTHPHVVGALEKHLIERLWLLAADTDQAASTVGAVLQPEPVPLAPEHGRARSSGTLTHAGLHAGAGEEDGLKKNVDLDFNLLNLFFEMLK